jgi:quinol monooxygenase YgiN
MYGRFGKIRTQPGQRDAMIAHLLHAADLLRDLDGCYQYIVSSDPHDPDGIWISEVWRSAEDHQASLSHEAIKTLIANARPLIAGFGENFEVTPLGGKGLTQTD